VTSPDDVVVLLDATKCCSTTISCGRSQREFGVESWDRYWAILEQLRAEAGYVDYLGALPHYRLGAASDPRLLLMSPVSASMVEVHEAPK
jgi:hypothetical protein